MSKMEGLTNEENLDNFESRFFLFALAVSNDINEPDINFVNDILLEIGCPYFPVENFKTVSDKLTGDTFFILYHKSEALRKISIVLGDFKLL